MLRLFVLFPLIAASNHYSLTFHALNQTEPSSNDTQVDGRFWIYSSSQPEVFSEVENTNAMEMKLWRPTPVKANVHSGDSDLFTAPGCICHGITRIFTCVTHWDRENDKDYRDAVTTVPLDTCATACQSGLFGKGPPGEGVTVYDENKPVKCVWNNDHVDEWSVITVTRMKFGIDSSRKNTVFRDHGVTVGCDVQTGVCTLEVLTAWIDKAKIGSDCSNPLEMFESCVWHEPLQEKLRGRLTCEESSEEYFLTDKVVGVDLCTMKLSAYMSTSKKWVTIAGYPLKPEHLYPVQADLTGSAVDFKLTEAVLGSISSLAEIRDKLRTNIGACPDFESYEDGNYAVMRGINLCTGHSLIPVQQVFLTTLTANETAVVKFFSDNRWEVGYLDPISGIIHKAPCGQTYDGIMGVQVNSSATYWVKNGTAPRLVLSSKTRISDIRLIRSAGTTPETGGNAKEFIDDEGNIPLVPDHSTGDTWYGSILSWILGTDWLIFKIVSAVVGLALLILLVYKAIEIRRGLMIPL